MKNGGSNTSFITTTGGDTNFIALDKSLKLNVDTNDFDLSFTHHVKSVLLFRKTYKILICLITYRILLKFVTFRQFFEILETNQILLKNWNNYCIDFRNHIK